MSARPGPSGGITHSDIPTGIASFRKRGLDSTGRRLALANCTRVLPSTALGPQCCASKAKDRVGTVDERSGNESSSQCRDRGHRHQTGQHLLGCESLDDIAKDHVTHSDRRADDSGQKKVQTADDR